MRPELQIETSVWRGRRPPVDRPVISFIAEAFKLPPEVSAIACAAIVETTAEKFVALTRRAAAELAGLQRERDPTLVRHIYDLHVIREHYDAAEVAALAREIMQADADTYGRQFPTCRDNPLAETLRAAAGIAADPGFAVSYATFRRDMVFGEAPEFAMSIATLEALATRVERSQA